MNLYSTGTLALDQKTRSVRGRNLRLIPVKSSKTSCGNCLEYGKNYLVPLTKKPVLNLDSFEYRKLKGPDSGIEITLSEKDAKILEKVTRKYTNQRLALVDGERVLQAPTIKSIIDGDRFNVTFRNQDAYMDLVRNLEDR